MISNLFELNKNVVVVSKKIYHFSLIYLSFKFGT